MGNSATRYFRERRPRHGLGTEQFLHLKAKINQDNLQAWPGGVECLNIALIGMTAAGKSSFANAVLTSMESDAFVYAFPVFNVVGHGPRRFMQLRVRDKTPDEENVLRICIWDMGGETSHESATKNVEDRFRHMLCGHYENGAIISDDQLPADKPLDNALPVVHGIIAVVAGSETSPEELALTRIKDLIKIATCDVALPHIPTIAVISKIDLIDYKLEQYPEKVYDSAVIEAAIGKVARALELQETDVFPVRLKSPKELTLRGDAARSLVLDAFAEIITRAHGALRARHG